MQLTLLKSKIHRATITQANLNYEGSITIDSELCRQARLLPFEKVEIYNCNNGERFATYVIYGGEGQICVNGAAARLVHEGDLVIICSYAQFEQKEAETYEPQLVFVDSQNKSKAKTR